MEVDNERFHISTQGDVSDAYVPAQEIILVWVFVINLHLQLLTRNFMDYNLM